MRDDRFRPCYAPSAFGALIDPGFLRRAVTDGCAATPADREIGEPPTRLERMVDAMASAFVVFVRQPTPRGG